MRTRTYYSNREKISALIWITIAMVVLVAGLIAGAIAMKHAPQGDEDRYVVRTAPGLPTVHLVGKLP